MAKHLLGKEVTAALNKKLKERAEAMKAEGITPTLAVVRCGENPSDLSYEAGLMKRKEKLGVEVKRIILEETCSRELLLGELKKLNEDPDVHGVLLFRPLPKPLRQYESEIRNALLPEKDVDGMTDLSLAGIFEGKAIGFPPCTPAACMEILDYYGIDPKGKNVTVIGRSLVVGKPVSMMLLDRNATVTICHTKTADLPSAAAGADILISTAGVPHFLNADYVRDGQVVIDVSINYDPSANDGKGGITGDAAFEEVEPIVGAITPVPGGVGSVTTSVLFDHVVTAAYKLKIESGL